MNVPIAPAPNSTMRSPSAAPGPARRVQPDRERLGDAGRVQPAVRGYGNQGRGRDRDVLGETAVDVEAVAS